MDIRFYKTFWGFSGSVREFADCAREDGYDGLELPAPFERTAQAELRSVLDDYGYDMIAEICTGGSYVPERAATMQDHLDDFDRKLEASLAMSPRQLNCMAGLDAWPLSQSIDFFGQLIEKVKPTGLTISFETHRSRILFNPWVARDLVLALPDLYFTCDFSHWCVVCERLIDTEDDALQIIIPRARHIHGRIGYDQGPQVPHPAAPEYAQALASHQRWWARCWTAMAEAGLAVATMTPEFGPDGYLHHLPFTNAPIADLRQINHWVMTTERRHFAEWQSTR
jgi:hypothetical protein